MQRRGIVKALAAGAVAPVFGRALAALAGESGTVTADMIREAEWISGLRFTDEERELMLADLAERLEGIAALRKVPLDNAVAPALRFDPGPGLPIEPHRGPIPVPPSGNAALPAGDDDVAFASLRDLSGWLRARRISSVELTRLYLERLARHDPELECVITRTEERALEQAAAADRRHANGTAAPLDGIPWGAKDLLAVPGYRTTWGAKPYEDQVRDDEATVVRRLDDAGAVLVAKLSVGALAWGDVWFGGKTRNPWNPEQGSSGSSAGPAAATAAGLVGFAIGTETWGSIVSPCTRCGVSGLRPTFGRVSRAGCMALSWSMDKIGPIARSVDDCAWIFAAIQGADGRDPTARDAPFRWPPPRRLREIRVGWVPELFERDRAEEAEDEDAKTKAREWQDLDRRTLKELGNLDLELIPVELPADLPVDALSLILTAEATTAFDELTRSGRDDLLVRQERHAWPNVFRQGQLIPAVEYLRANRVRALLQERLRDLFRKVDVYVTPTFGGSNLLLTNLTGHPQVVVPNGFRASDGTPTSITFTGACFGEEELLAVAAAYQEATDWHRRRPPLG